MEALQLYRGREQLRNRGKLDPRTGQVYGKLGMAQCCRQIEEENNLLPGSISKTTLSRWQRNGVVDANSIRKGRTPVLPLVLEENLIKLVLACDSRGDEKAGPDLVCKAVGLYISGTSYEKDFKECYPGRWREDKGIIVPGKKWLHNWEKRMKALPAYKRIVKCRGRGMDVNKIRYVLCACAFCGCLVCCSTKGLRQFHSDTTRQRTSISTMTVPRRCTVTLGKLLSLDLPLNKRSLHTQLISEGSI